MKRPVYMAKMPSICEQGYDWQCISLAEYIKYKATGEYEVRIDWYSWFTRPGE